MNNKNVKQKQRATIDKKLKQAIKTAERVSKRNPHLVYYVCETFCYPESNGDEGTHQFACISAHSLDKFVSKCYNPIIAYKNGEVIARVPR